MKWFNRIILVLFVVLAVFLLFRTFYNSDERALNLMTNEEKIVLEKMSKIDKNSTREDFIAILGDPNEDIVFSLKWNNFGDSFLSQGRAYFDLDGKIIKFRILKLGYFFYEKDYSF